MKNIANFASSVILAVCAASVSSFADGLPTGYTQDDAYLFAYFSDKGHGRRRGEAAGMRLAYSYDGLKWTALNCERPFLVPEVGKAKLLRDPSICRGPDGTFHVVWTTGWGERVIGHATSKDLVEWSAQQEIPVMAHEPAARNCWAPEVTYDPAGGLFYIYWATSIPGRHSGDGVNQKGKSNHRIYVTTTKDWKSFSPTRLWFNPDFSAIDAALVRVGGRWLMTVKNENDNTGPGHPAEKNIRTVWTDSLEEPWEGKAISSPINFTRDWVEGPSPLIVGNAIYVYFDCYMKHRYGAVKSIDGGKTWRDASSEVSFPMGVRHGTAFAVPKKMVDALVGRYAATGE